MKSSTFRLDSTNGSRIHISLWEPDSADRLTAVIQIAHGMTETGARYERFASALTAAGYAVYANDHLGHGLTAANADELGHLAKGDMMNMVYDMERISRYIREQHPNVPLILFGHSMGSFLSQMYLSKFGQLLDGVILCGSNGPRGPELLAGVLVSRVSASISGWKHRSTFINNLAFGGFNRRFKPHHTEFDWLSRDESEVQKYIDDPMCGYVCTVGFYHEFFNLLRAVHQPAVMANIPKDIPVFMISGTQDPVGNFGVGVLKLAEMYKQLGIKDVAVKMYPEARHELLNETNRDEVTSDCLAWINQVVLAVARAADQ